MHGLQIRAECAQTLAFKLFTSVKFAVVALKLKLQRAAQKKPLVMQKKKKKKAQSHSYVPMQS